MHYLSRFALLFQFLSFVIFLYIEKKNLEKSLFPVSFSYIAFDSFMHLCSYVILAMPLLRFRNEFIIGAFVIILIDIDHIVKAKSFTIENLLSLGRRPYTHSLIFVLIISALVWFFSKNIILAYVIFISLVIHFLKDLIEGKTYIFFPYKYFYSYSFPAYIYSSLIVMIINWGMGSMLDILTF